MHHCKTYISIFWELGISQNCAHYVKTVHTIIVQFIQLAFVGKYNNYICQKCKLHKFATTNFNFKENIGILKNHVYQICTTS